MDEDRNSFDAFSTPPPDRRNDERYTTLLRVGVVEIAGGKELCLIRNISAGGLKAHVYSAMPVGARTAVELKSGQPVSGRVIWADGANVGIRFDSEIDVDDVLTACTTGVEGQRPRMPRIDVDCFANLRIGARTYRARATDISQGGVKLQVDAAIGTDAVVVTLAGFRPLHGRVRWCDGRQAGIVFNQIIPLPELIGWLKERVQLRRASGVTALGNGQEIAA